jgi:hypothetical protein
MCGLIVAISNWWDNRKEKKEKELETSLNQDAAARRIMDESLEESKKTVKETMEQTKGTRDLLLEMLTKIGCQYEIDENDGQIQFTWQGGHFMADAANDCAFVVVWFLFWEEYELYDIDTLSRVKRVINDANINYNINVFYTINEEGNTFHVHSKKHFMLMKQIPDIESYLQTIFGMFFQVRQYVELEIEKAKQKEESMAQ